jgi:hypothetical protein
LPRQGTAGVTIIDMLARTLESGIKNSSLQGSVLPEIKKLVPYLLFQVFQEVHGD